jgi:c-di-GMP-binding flagellar brake protein YcgR
MTAASNKRTESRRNCFVPVESKSDSSFDQTQTVDISRHGIGFISPHPHAINEKIAIEIQLKPNTDPVLVIGIVKWVRRISDSEQYRVGMNYDEVISGSPRRLDSYFEARA